MMIYHLSSAPFTGGAARAGFRLHQGLLAEGGVETTWLDPGAGAHGEGVISLPTDQAKSSQRTRFKRRRWSKVVRQHFTSATPPASNPIGWGSVDMLAKLPAPDLWNLHWTSWFLDWENMLPWMAGRAPIVWTLHDLNTLNGIWHYEPEINEKTPARIALEAKAIELKRRALAKISPERLTFVGPSRWMVNCCRNSAITERFPCEHIPYGLDTTVFSPKDPTLLRKMMEISVDVPVIGFIADNLNDPRKGTASLRQALTLLGKKHPDIHLVTVGKGQIDCGGLPHIHLGALQTDQLLQHFYSACDLFVCPSLQDNLPNTVLESIACHTPVVAYLVGGMPDMVHDGINGMLVEQVGDGTRLATAIEAVLTRTDYPSIKSEEWPPFEFSASRQSATYMKLYGAIV